MRVKILSVLVLMLLSLPVAAEEAAFSPFPKAADKYWRRQVPEAMRKDYIRLGDRYLGKPWEAIPDEVFAEFRTNGNRTNYEAMCFSIRTQFACLVMAEIMEHKGRFMPDICRGLHYFMEKEPWWGIPAHYPKPLPERETQPVDLFNAETASMLAWTLYMLDREIDKREKGLSRHVKREIESRFLRPAMYEKQGWKANANNWNTWITSNRLETILICKQDARRKAEAVEDVKQCLRTFLRGYPDDGGCEEGVGYWDRAAASFFESLYFLRTLPEEQRLQLTPQEEEKVRAMGKFITTMHIHDLTFVNFSDAQAQNVPNINILFPYGAWLGDKGMMELAAYVGQKHGFLQKPSELFLLSGNFPTLGRELMLLSMLPEYQATRPAQPRVADAYLANSQIMVASTPEWLVAAKGGHNAESHNHNDIGNFIIYHNDRPVVIDLGRDTYTSLTFSNRRFELMNNRSAYHNVPLLGGVEQKDGRRYRATGAAHASDDRASVLQLNLAAAYPDEAHVGSWTRAVILDRIYNKVEIYESYCFDSLGRENAVVLMCYGEPVLQEPGRILLQEGKVRLSYDAARLSPRIEKVEMADGIMKRQWGDNVYRILLVLPEEKTGVFRYHFEEID